ncbi:homoserine kinase [Pseudonocardiaceae bacterium YIM PH 21723]|nr:homoserine kinase [Pseudonocardiaceae bacterium YIM PH 21723]
MQRPVADAVSVVVPASTANLGSGFDALGMALALHDTVEFEVTDGGVEVQVEGEGAGAVPTDERHLVVQAFQKTAQEIGLELPGIALRCKNQIPHSRGLGSSAAAAVAGVLGAYALAGRQTDDLALQLAAGFEGHADNAAASLLGGLVIAWQQHERFRAVRLEPHRDLAPVVLIPATESATSTTRGLLPAQVPHADAAFAAGRSALAVHALTQRPDLLLPATADRIHQRYRVPAWPESAELVAQLRTLGIAAAISGAGPTVIALPTDHSLPAEISTEGFTVTPLAVDRTGATAELLG